MTTQRHAGEVALVTGANKGIGREIARRLAAEGMTVYLGARDDQRGRIAAQELGGDGVDVRFVQVDVTDQAQIEAAAKQVDGDFGRLDVLVNNAGIGIEWGSSADEVTVEQMRRTFEVNVFGVVAVTRAFIPLLRRSAAGRVVNLSSPLGSLSLIGDPDDEVSSVGLLAYSSSKTAVNSITQLYANALRGDITVNAVSPGFVATDLNHHRGQLSTGQGAELPVRLALDADRTTGAFLQADHRGEPAVVPW
ncbi:MAG: SDR family oxidoreductase [Nocardioidaceae bacterium]|jgi:NAD(P)-dependent dehydrogenase (short-subunit alcohol dehydrogenase family)|nr:SDR family oxidoreductase [Nocardioidaceae bacterium]